MCETRRRASTRLRWGTLYLRLLVAGVIGALIATSPLSSAARTALGVAVTLGASVSALAWLRANAGALDQTDWCACASRSMTVRVIASTPRRRRRRRRRRATLAV